MIPLKILVLLLQSFSFTVANVVNHYYTQQEGLEDLAAIAERYFAEKDIEVNDLNKASLEVKNSSLNHDEFLKDISREWEMNGSLAMVLLKLASFIDEVDEAGNLSSRAKMIRGLATKSFERQGEEADEEFEDFADSDDLEEVNRDVPVGQPIPLSKLSSNLGREALLIEQKYRGGERKEADALVEKWIDRRWNVAAEGTGEGRQKQMALLDLNESSARGHHALLSALISKSTSSAATASSSRSILKFSPEAKATIVNNLLNLQNVQISPPVLKWLLAAEPDEQPADQSKLLNLIQSTLKKKSQNDPKRQQKSTQVCRKNSLIDLFEEVEEVQEKVGKKESTIGTNEKMSEEGSAAIKVQLKEEEARNDAAATIKEESSATPPQANHEPIDNPEDVYVPEENADMPGIEDEDAEKGNEKADGDTSNNQDEHEDCNHRKGLVLVFIILLSIPLAGFLAYFYLRYRERAQRLRQMHAETTQIDSSLVV